MAYSVRKRCHLPGRMKNSSYYSATECNYRSYVCTWHLNLYRGFFKVLLQRNYFLFLLKFVITNSIVFSSVQRNYSNACVLMPVILQLYTPVSHAVTDLLESHIREICVKQDRSWSWRVPEISRAVYTTDVVQNIVIWLSYLNAQKGRKDVLES